MKIASIPSDLGSLVERNGAWRPLCEKWGATTAVAADATISLTLQQRKMASPALTDAVPRTSRNGLGKGEKTPEKGERGASPENAT